ncbi:MAG TPA: hypothetical protein VNL71_06435, partial [Chloroflexota bacterium]|nr:hypothetical protein [Chloroflexota bacterium]
MSTPSASIKITPTIDYHQAVENVRRISEALKDLKKEAADAQKVLLQMTQQAAAQISPGARIQSTADAQRFLRTASGGAITSGGFMNPESLQEHGAKVGPGLRPSLDALSKQHQAAKAALEKDAELREAKADLERARNSPEGYVARRRAGLLHSRDINALGREVDLEELATPEGQKDLATRAFHSRRLTHQKRFMGQMVDPAARRQAAADLGIKLPEDVHPFAKLLQGTFKTATSLGMLEALSGGSAAPLARAFAANIIGNALLPSALQTLGGMGGSVGNAAGSLMGRLVSGGSSSAAGNLAGNAAASAGGADAGAVAGGAADAGAAGGAGALGALGGIGAVAAVVALAAGGLALYSQTQVNAKNAIEASLQASTWGGMGMKNPNDFIDQLVGSSGSFDYKNQDVQGVMGTLGNMGVGTG